MTHRSPSLRERDSELYVEINPTDAAELKMRLGGFIEEAIDYPATCLSIRRKLAAKHSHTRGSNQEILSHF